MRICDYRNNLVRIQKKSRWNHTNKKNGINHKVGPTKNTKKTQITNRKYTPSTKFHSQPITNISPTPTITLTKKKYKIAN